MGYTTIFEGEFELDRPLEDEAYNKIMEWVNEPENLRWVPTEDRKGFVWDGEEKLKGKTAMDQIWLLIEDILKPRGYVINGIVNAQGEDEEDQWHIQVENYNVDSRMGFNKLVPEPIGYKIWAEEYYGRWLEMSRLNLDN